jgi:hypothetical protein
MKKAVAAALVSVAVIGASGAWTAGEARQRGGVAVLDMVGGDMNVQCGARRGNGQPQTTATFVYHVTMTSVTGGAVRLQFADNPASFIDFPIAAGATLSFSQVGGAVPGFNDVVTVTGAGTATDLQGTISALFDPGARPHPTMGGAFCRTN